MKWIVLLLIHWPVFNSKTLFYFHTENFTSKRGNGLQYEIYGWKQLSKYSSFHYFDTFPSQIRRKVENLSFNTFSFFFFFLFADVLRNIPGFFFHFFLSYQGLYGQRNSFHACCVRCKTVYGITLLSSMRNALLAINLKSSIRYIYLSRKIKQNTLFLQLQSYFINSCLRFIFNYFS